MIKKNVTCLALSLGILLSAADAAVVILESSTPSTDSLQFDASSDAYYVFSQDVFNASGPAVFSALTSDGAIMTDGVAAVTTTWSGGTPTASGSTGSAAYIGMGSSYPNPGTFGEFSVTMPASSGTLEFWIQPNSNGSSFSIDYDVTVGGVTSSYTDTDNTNLQHFTYSITGATVGESVTVRFDNVSGTNTWHNMPVLAAELTVVPEPATFAAVLGSLLGIAVIARRRRARV